MYSYTENRENALFSQWDDVDDPNFDYSSVINELNSAKAFRSFGDGLLSFLQRHNPDLTIETAIKYIESLCENKGIQKSDIASTNTFKSWFAGGPRPKKGEDGRRSLFALAFAMSLSPDETAELFHKVYLDRAFDYRNTNEIIYYYCLSNNKSWQDANRLIASAHIENIDDSDATVYTAQIKTDIEAIINESMLLGYISKHGHNLQKKNDSAKNTMQKLLSEANALAKKESETILTVDVKTHKDETEEVVFESQFAGCDKDSLNFTYDVITDLRGSGTTGTITLFKNARLPKEIKNRFPEAVTLSKKEPTYEELRKFIILLASYITWCKSKFAKQPVDIEDYIEEINVYLNESGFSLMYYGNPYDWMFLYCALSDRPLDTFRGLMAEVLEEE